MTRLGDWGIVFLARRARFKSPPGQMNIGGTCTIKGDGGGTEKPPPPGTWGGGGDLAAAVTLVLRRRARALAADASDDGGTSEGADESAKKKKLFSRPNCHQRLAVAGSIRNFKLFSVSLARWIEDFQPCKSWPVRMRKRGADLWFLAEC